MVRGAFEYQGQKCSAASRVYVPKSIWRSVRDRVVGHIEALRVGDVRDFRTMMGAVIDARAYARLTAAIAEAKNDSTYAIVAGGNASDERGYFIHPTLVEARSPTARLLREELFGPLLTVFVFDDAKEDEALTACDEAKANMR